RDGLALHLLHVDKLRAFFFFQAEDGIRDGHVTGVQTCALPIWPPERVIPIGYGKRGGFPLHWFARHPTERFVEECKKRGIEAKRIVVLEPGESWHYYK